MARLDRLANFARSLTGRMVLGLSVVHIFLLPVFFTSVLYLVKEGHEAQFANQVRIDSHMFGSLLAQDFDEARVQGLLTDAVMGGQAIFAQIITQQGRVIESASGIHLKADQFQEDFFFGQRGDTVYYISVPLYDSQGSMLANLRLGYDETPTLELIHSTYRRGLVLAALYILLTVPLIGVLALQLTRPLRSLRDAAQRIAAGDTTEHLQVKTTITEVLNLSDDLEAMRRELINQSEVMEHQTLHDTLTGLPNRNLFNDRLEQAIIAARRSGTTLAVCMLDMNNFKQINDTLGHHMGDLALQKTALRMRAALRASDTVARLGGDEFTILMPEVDDREHATVVMEKLIKALEEPLHLDDSTLDISASIGIALYPGHGGNSEALMRNADIAMYDAKKASRSLIFFSPKES